MAALNMTEMSDEILFQSKNSDSGEMKSTYNALFFKLVLYVWFGLVAFLVCGPYFCLTTATSL